MADMSKPLLLVLGGLVLVVLLTLLQMLRRALLKVGVVPEPGRIESIYSERKRRNLELVRTLAKLLQVSVLFISAVAIALLIYYA